MMTATGTGIADASHLLRQARELTEPELHRAVNRLAEPVRSVARYHFDWQDAAGESVPATRGKAALGKGIRGALVLASAQAVGAPFEQAVPAAAAVELVHNFSLLHDDVMDGDRNRRGRPAAWCVFGTGQAILAGDALLTLAIDVIARDRNFPSRGAAVSELCSALLRLAAGQSADLSFESRTDVGLDECLTMAAGKTASLLASACALGALAGGADLDRVEALRGFGHHLGLAFQLVDDLLGIWGDTLTTGKSVGSDLRSRKKSLPVVAAIRSDTTAGRRLTEIYHNTDPMHDTDVLETARLIEDAGGRDWASTEAARQRDLALRCLAAALPSRDGACALTLIADLVAHREKLTPVPVPGAERKGAPNEWQQASKVRIRARASWRARRPGRSSSWICPYSSSRSSTRSCGGSAETGSTRAGNSAASRSAKTRWRMSSNRVTPARTCR